MRRFWSWIPYIVHVWTPFRILFKKRLEILAQQRQFQISKKSLSMGERRTGKSLEQLKELESARAPTNRLGTSSTSLGRETRFRGGWCIQPSFTASFILEFPEFFSTSFRATSTVLVPHVNPHVRIGKLQLRELSNRLIPSDTTRVKILIRTRTWVSSILKIPPWSRSIYFCTSINRSISLF